MRARRLRVMALPVIASVAAGGLAACGSSGSSAGGSGTSTGTIKIGEVCSKTGPYAGAELGTCDSVPFAVSQLNAKGGITVNGKKYMFKAVVLDSRGDSTVAASDAHALISDNVAAIFGDEYGETEGIVPITQGAKMLQFSSSSTIEADLTGKYCCLFRTSISAKYRDPEWFKAAAALLAPIVGHKNLKIAFALPNDADFQALAKSWPAAANANGFTTIKTTLYDPTTTDFSGVASGLVNAHPDVIFGPPVPASVESLVRSLTTLGYKGPMIFPAVPPNIAGNVSNAVVTLFTGPQFTKPTSSRVQTFVNQYKSWLSSQNRSLPAAAEGVLFYYDGVHQLAEQMQAQKCIPGPSATSCNLKVAKALVGTSYAGIYGTTKYDGTHRISYPVDGCVDQTGTITCKSFSP